MWPGFNCFAESAIPRNLGFLVYKINSIQIPRYLGITDSGATIESRPHFLPRPGWRLCYSMLFKSHGMLGLDYVTTEEVRQPCAFTSLFLHSTPTLPYKFVQ